MARDGERLLSVPQLVVFLRGFPYAAFPQAAPGLHGNLAYFPAMMLGSCISPLHPRNLPALSPKHSVGAEHLTSYRTTLQLIPNLSSSVGSLSL